MNKLYLLVICLMLSMKGLAQEKDEKFNEGLLAFDERHYAEAYKILKPYAEKGNCVAQYVMGFSYQYGLSVKIDNKQARRWLQLAAEQKQTNAMGPLAVLLFEAEDTNAIVKAYMWAMLAVEYVPSQKPTTSATLIKSYMSPAQLAQAEKLITTYKLKWKDTPDCR